MSYEKLSDQKKTVDCVAAYVLDLDPRKVNLQTIELQPVVQYGAKDRGLFSVDRRSGDSLIEQQSTDGMKKNRDAKTLENLLIEHYHNTRSSVAQTILANLPEYFPRSGIVVGSVG